MKNKSTPVTMRHRITMGTQRGGRRKDYNSREATEREAQTAQAQGKRSRG